MEDETIVELAKVLSISIGAVVALKLFNYVQRERLSPEPLAYGLVF